MKAQIIFKKDTGINGGTFELWASGERIENVRFLALDPNQEHLIIEGHEHWPFRFMMATDNGVLVEGDDGKLGFRDHYVVPEEERPRIVCFIQETERANDGGYLVCMAVEGERGFHRTDWNWGSDLVLAKKLCDERNEHQGISPKEAMDIILGTMRKG